jgi:hypothetical protein
LLPHTGVLKNIVVEGLCGLFNNIGYNDCIKKRQDTRQARDAVLRIVYGTMKYLPYYNPQFLGSLFPVKVVMLEQKVKLSADSAEQQVSERMEDVLAEYSRPNESRAGKQHSINPPSRNAEETDEQFPPDFLRPNRA